MTRKTNPTATGAPAVGSQVIQLNTPPRAEGVGGPALPPADAVRALRVVGKNIELRLAGDKSIHVLGSAPATEIDLSLRVAGIDEPDRISRVHAIVTRVDNWIRITDHNSTNGTFYQGRREATIHLTAGGRFEVDVVPLIALDDHLLGVRDTLHRFLGFTDIRAVDLASEAIGNGDPLVIVGDRDNDLDELAKAVHKASGRRERPFVTVSLDAPLDEQKPKVARARRGSVFVDVSTGTLTKQLVDYLFSRDYGVRPIFAAADLDTMHRSLGPQSSNLRQIQVPALRARPADIPHLFNAMCIAAGSQRRLEQLTRERLEAVCAFPWTFAEMRQNLDAVLAYLTHDCNISAAARALGVKPPSLHGRLARIHVIKPQPKPKR